MAENNKNLIGLVLVTHGNLALEFISAMQHVVGKQENIAPVCIGPEDDMEMRRQEILDKVENVDSGAGVVVLTDMFGGTPSNLAISIMDRANVEIIAGVNLPMLIKIAALRKEKSLKEKQTILMEIEDYNTFYTEQNYQQLNQRDHQLSFGRAVQHQPPLATASAQGSPRYFQP